MASGAGAPDASPPGLPEEGPARSERPGTAEQWAQLGERQLHTGHLDGAIASFTHATELEPAVALHWGRLGRALAGYWRYDEAERALRKACALDPNLTTLRLALADACLQQNKAGEAIEEYRRALAAEPDNIHAAVAEALVLPPIYASTADLAAWRDRFAQGLEGLHAALPRFLARPQSVLAVETTNFYLPYQGRNDRALQSAYSEFLAALLGAAALGLQTPIARRTRAPGAKIRVGFMSSNLRACTIGDYFGSWITELPRERFEVCALFTGALPDVRTQALARAADEAVLLTDRVDEIARAARSRNLDVLVFPDVGMSVWSSLLANLRMAPVQCAAWGHPVTTGSSFVDYFLSCAEMEPAGAAEHYREQLVLLPGLGTRYRLLPVEKAYRQRFGLPSDKRIYLCPQSLYKIHPETDALLLELLARDEEAVLVFFAATTAGQRRAFVERLQAGMRARGLPPRQQVKLLPLVSHRDFRSIMGLADVMLDTLHWSGGRTSIDALGAGLPIVTLPGAMMRGRQSAAMLRIVGVEELIARDAEEYVEIALRVARDRAWREALSARIREGLSRLVDRSEPIAALADALERMVA